MRESPLISKGYQLAHREMTPVGSLRCVTVQYMATWLITLDYKGLEVTTYHIPCEYSHRKLMMLFICIIVNNVVQCKHTHVVDVCTVEG